MTDIATGLIDLGHPALGTRAVFASDDFFAPKERMISPADPVFVPGKYDDHGKWMDGWESRRKRDAGHDHCVIRLGRPGLISNVDIDTRNFTGNFPPAASLEACVSDDEIPATGWTEILPVSPLGGDRHNEFAIAQHGPWTHLRLNIFPDGGIARLRIYGRIAPDWSSPESQGLIDLASALSGARPVICNDEHFGKLGNLLWPGRAATMGEGWETRRRRVPGHDWGIIELGHPGVISKIIVDTAHFKGNYPDMCSIQATGESSLPVDVLAGQSMFWPSILPQQKLSMDREHVFEREIAVHGPVQFVRLNIFPDGGVSRLRLFGRAALKS